MLKIPKNYKRKTKINSLRTECVNKKKSDVNNFQIKLSKN